MNIALFGQLSRVWTFADHLSRTQLGVVFGASSHALGHEIAEKFVMTFQRAVQGGSYHHAARVSDVVLLSDPLAPILSEDERMPEALTGKVLIDLKDLFGPSPGGQVSLDVPNTGVPLPNTKIVPVRRIPGATRVDPSGRYPAQAPVLANPKTAATVVSVLTAVGIDLVAPQATARAVDPDTHGSSLQA